MTLHKPLVRGLTIYHLMTSGHARGADGLAADLRVSRRTVLRDLRNLRLAGCTFSFDKAHRLYRLAAPYRNSIARSYDSPLVRCLALRELLGQGRACTAQELADRFGVSRRTALRDLAALRRAGCVVAMDEKTGAYRLIRG